MGQGLQGDSESREWPSPSLQVIHCYTDREPVPENLQEKRPQIAQPSCCTPKPTQMLLMLSSDDFRCILQVRKHSADVQGDSRFGA